MVAHARFNSVRIGTRARDLEDLDVDQEFMGFPLSQGFVFVSSKRFIILDECSDCAKQAGAVRD